MEGSSNEQKPLLHHRPTESASVRFSQRLVKVGENGHAEEEDEDPTPSTRRMLFHSNSSLSGVFEALTKSERQEALKKEGVGGAAFLIRDAILGDSHASVGTCIHVPVHSLYARVAMLLIPQTWLYDLLGDAGTYDPYGNPEHVFRNLVSIICRRLINYTPFLRIQFAALWMLVFLTFIEPPVWCQRWDPDDAEGCLHLLTKTGVALGEDDETAEPVLYYPNTRSMFLTTHQSFLVECVCLAVVAFFSLLRFGR